MGMPLTIQPEDDAKIRALQQRLGAKSKIEVVREGLALLERETLRQEEAARWKKAVAMSKASSAEFMKEMVRARSRLK
jgi:Arc/MetJ-type ribon-helix-helix transcriptional regulator